MKRIQPTAVAVTASAIRLAEARPDRKDAQDLLRRLRSRGLQVLVVGEAEPDLVECVRAGGRLVDPRQVPHVVTADCLVAVGVTAVDAELREHATIYFHLGEMADLQPRVGVAVPIVGQGVAGLLNALQWVLSASAGVELAQHGDVVEHAAHCAAGYQEDDKPLEMERYARQMASELQRTFANVVGILGTGFPFYCMDSAWEPASTRYPVPESIRHFTSTQAAFFASKLAPPDLHADAEVTLTGLRDAGREPGQSEFNRYEYERWGARSPTPPDSGTLRDFFAANTLETADRLWPCDVCTAVHDPAKYPRQAWIRDFMNTCMPCHQTAFLPRAVGVLGSDVDLIVVADLAPGDRGQLAEEIGAWIDRHPNANRHDTDWARQLRSSIGPLDVFTVAAADFWLAVDTIAAGEEWMTVTVPCDVGWLPITRIDYEIGKYFALCVELLLSPDPSFVDRFLAAQAGFASQVTAKQVIAAYEADSFYLQQLAQNDTVRKLLEARSRRWAGQTAAG